MTLAVAHTDPMVPQVARVLKKTRELSDTVTLEIEVPEGTAPFAPGQFNMLDLFGVGEVAISFSGNPSDTSRLVHTIRAVGKVSAALDALRVGDVLGIRGPYGAGWPMEAADGQDVVVIAGGLGLAPLRPALYRLMTERARFGNVTLLYGARGPEEILYRHELENWRRRLDMDIEVTVDHGTEDWHGHVGVVPKLIGHAAFDPLNTVSFVCGPEIMMRFSLSALREAGVADGNIYLSMERNMKCAIGLCGHCQFGPVFVCRDGPVFPADRIARLMMVKEL